MPKTESSAIALGSPAPDFVLSAPDGRTVRLADYDGTPALLVAFISNRCPFVLLIREEFAAFARDYAQKGLAVLAINANDPVAHPEESLERVAAESREQGYAFAYVKDTTQEVARAFNAACTPEFYLYDKDRRLAYHGQFDDARPGSDRPVTGAVLRAAADAVLSGRPVPGEQRPSIGCNIKWAPGSTPTSVSDAA